MLENQFNKWQSCDICMRRFSVGENVVTILEGICSQDTVVKYNTSIPEACHICEKCLPDGAFQLRQITQN